MKEPFRRRKKAGQGVETGLSKSCFSEYVQLGKRRWIEERWVFLERVTLSCRNKKARSELHQAYIKDEYVL